MEYHIMRFIKALGRLFSKYFSGSFGSNVPANLREKKYGKAAINGGAAVGLWWVTDALKNKPSA